MSAPNFHLTLHDPSVSVKIQGTGIDDCVCISFGDFSAHTTWFLKDENKLNQFTQNLLDAQLKFNLAERGGTPE